MGIADSPCIPIVNGPLSDRIANYQIEVELAHESKMLHARQQLNWRNNSPDTVFEMRFYMYMNAFRDLESTYLRTGKIFDQSIVDRPKESFGWIEVYEVFQRGYGNLSDNMQYVQPDDGNLQDKTVLAIKLGSPVPPGGTVVLDMNFKSKLPRIFARAGHANDNFFNVVHWFPQVGVWEEKPEGHWDWNCHQFMQGTEFFAEFGNYEVVITTGEEFVLGASGCMENEKSLGNGKKVTTFWAEDIIDFGWTAFPHFEVFNDTWRHVNIKLLTPTAHAHHAPRLIKAVKSALIYLDEHVGPYPYTTITMMDPPIHGLRSGFMEYPTYITLGAFAFFPRGMKSLESLVVHEFSHQYFMGMVATNEKEEPWLDEGFVTYFEDRVMEEFYGPHSLTDLLAYEVDNSEHSRLEYVQLNDPAAIPLSRPGWEYINDYKGFVYSKTATVFKTMERLLGIEVMNAIIKKYFARHQFKHPKGEDFKAVVKEEIGEGRELGGLDSFFDQAIYGTQVSDFSLEDVSLEDNRARFTVKQNGDFIIPVEVVIQYCNGASQRMTWNGVGSYKVFEIEGEEVVKSIMVDPDRKIYLDLNFTNQAFVNPKCVHGGLGFWSNLTRKLNRFTAGITFLWI